MDSHVRASEIASYLSDVQEEFSPSRLAAYTSEVRPLLPTSARADLDSAVEQLALAQANIQRAASRMGMAGVIEGLRL